MHTNRIRAKEMRSKLNYNMLKYLLINLIISWEVRICTTETTVEAIIKEIDFTEASAKSGLKLCIAT